MVGIARARFFESARVLLAKDSLSFPPRHFGSRANAWKTAQRFLRTALRDSVVTDLRSPSDSGGCRGTGTSDAQLRENLLSVACDERREADAAHRPRRSGCASWRRSHP